MSRSTQKKMKTMAGAKVASDTAAIKMSGADLQQAVLTNLASTSVGAGKDGARLEQMSEGF